MTDEKDDTVTRETVGREMERLAREAFGFEQLHRGQRAAIESVVAGRDTLAVMPTGSGKSAIYQIAGHMLPGPTVIVSPLLALQRDQIHDLEEREIGEAAAVNSSIKSTELHETWKALSDSDLDFLFIAPEQFHQQETLDRLKEAGSSLFVVDEAHCISEWGQDFRPDFLRLGAVIEELGHPPVLALTATAASPVRDEIVERLGLRTPTILVEGFDRPNIWLAVEHYHDESVKRADLLDAVAAEKGPGIVYVSTHRHAEEIAEALRERDVAAVAYHGGLPSSERTEAEDAFMANEVVVMVATSAFGMGIDKPDIRFVFHHDVPESIDAYYQEIGRAGRDGQPARALLFYRPEDLAIHRFFAGGGKIDEAVLTEVAEAVEVHEGPVSLAELKEETELSGAKLETAVTRLEEVGAIDILPTGKVEEGENAPVVEEVFKQALREEEHRRATTASRLDMMRGYAEGDRCRRQYLLNYFGEQCEPLCGYCDRCERGMVATEPVDEPFPLHSRVRHAAFGDGQVQRYESDSVIVLFDDVGYKTLLTEFVVDSGALHALE